MTANEELLYKSLVYINKHGVFKHNEVISAEEFAYEIMHGKNITNKSPYDEYITSYDAIGRLSKNCASLKNAT